MQRLYRWFADKDYLESMFAGVSRPEDMGTTGLTGWVLAGPGGARADWNRTRKAASIIRRRGLPVDRFARAVLALVTNRWSRARFESYFKTLLK